MPLVTTNEMLKKAQAGHYAVGAFNVENMEMVMAVIKAAEDELPGHHADDSIHSKICRT